MLYVFCGDRFLAREGSRNFVDACKKKRENAEYIYLSNEHRFFSLEELLNSQGLFEKKYIVFCDELIKGNLADHVLENLKNYAEVPHMFVLFEPTMEKKLIKDFEKKGAVVKSFEKKEKEDYKNPFSFLETFLQFDKEKSFVKLHKLLNEGEDATSILNILFWQLRILVLVSKSASSTEAGLKPFVYSKAKKALEKVENPFDLFLKSEKALRNGRVNGFYDSEIIESIIFIK